MRTHKEGGQSKYEAIERSEIWGALSGTIGDEQLLLEQQRLGGHSTGAARAEEFRESDKQVDHQEKQVAHESDVITSANLRKTVRQRLSGPEFTNSHPTSVLQKAS